MLEFPLYVSPFFIALKSRLLPDKIVINYKTFAKLLDGSIIGIKTFINIRDIVFLLALLANLTSTGAKMNFSLIVLFHLNFTFN